MNKERARAAARAAVSSLTEEERRASGKIIEGLALEFVRERGARSVFVYVSTGTEPPTDGIISSLLSEGVAVYVPFISGEDMLLSKIDKDTALRPGKYGIPCADGGVPFKDADVNLIPLVAWDPFRNRAGRGKGYYDRYLKNASGVSAALAYSASMVDFIETHDGDVRPDCVITERGIVR